MMRGLLDSAGGRKFVLALGAGVVSSVLVWFGKITPDAYSTVILATVAAYIVGNVGQKVIGPKP